MKKNNFINFFLFIILIMLFIVSILFIGRYSIKFSDFFYLTAEELSKFKHIIMYIRFPRIMAAVLVGAALSVSGATYQAVFKNPMVSPDILGASSGSAFGIALSIIMHFSYINTLLVAFICGIISVILSYGISRLFLQDKKFSLILSGIMISTIFSSMLSYIKLIADPNNELPDITYWLMGRLSGTSLDTIYFSLIPFLIGFLVIIVLRWRINLFTIGDEEIKTLGIDEEKTKILLISASTLLTSITVSICGIIGFIGLVIPHFSRLLVGNNYKTLIFTTILGGALFLIIIDNIARTISTYEVPLGILTSIIGAPIFLLLMIRGRYA